MKKTLNELKNQINKSQKITNELKVNINNEIDALKYELSKLEDTHPELAKTIARKTLTDILNKINNKSTEQNEEEFIEDLVLNFEASHPKITSTLQNIVNLLAGIGI